MTDAAEKKSHPDAEGSDLQAAADMELEAQSPVEPEPMGNDMGKREREEGEQGENGEAKKQKVEKSVEEKRLESLEGEQGEDGESKKQALDKSAEEGEGRVGGGQENGKPPASVRLGPKVFGTSMEMFDYFYKLLHSWTPLVDINKYEHMVLLDLLKKGHSEPCKKLGDGIQAFQVRNHPLWKSRCFFLLRIDGSSDDFSFRKCVDHLLPLPDNMKPQNGIKASNNQKNVAQRFGGRGGRSGGRGGRGRRGGP